MTTHRRLPEPMGVWRIGDPDGRYPVFDSGGAALVAGRWHERGEHVVYTAEHYSTAMLEKLVHWNGVLPRNQHAIEVVLPAGLSYEVVTAESLPGWDAPFGDVARAFGSEWYDELRSAVLIVPSFVARVERNVIVNARHPEFGRIRPGLEMPVRWDERLKT